MKTLMKSLRQNIREALKKQLGLLDLNQSAIRIQKPYGGTQRVTTTLSAEAALKLLAVGNVKISWVVCLLRSWTYSGEIHR